MTRGRRHSFDQIAGLLRLIQVRIKEGKKLSQACFEAGITEYTFYRWQAECNLASSLQIQYRTALEKENDRLRHMVTALQMERAESRKSDIVCDCVPSTNATYRQRKAVKSKENHESE